MSSPSAEVAELLDACFAAPEDVEKLTAFDAVFRPRMLLVLAATYPEHPAYAEDAYQDAFLVYLRLFRAGKKPHIANYVTYFTAVAKHCLVNHLRKQRAHVSLDTLVEEELPSTGETEERRTADRLDVLEAILRLPRRCQYILEARYLRAVPDGTLAAELGIEAVSVPMTVKRCRDQLREKLRKDML
jgi:RNA polymerase sigma factor (sigma-70 family)